MDVSTISTACGQALLTQVDNLSTGYPQFVDNIVLVDNVIKSENTNIISNKRKVCNGF